MAKNKFAMAMVALLGFGISAFAQDVEKDSVVVDNPQESSRDADLQAISEQLTELKSMTEKTNKQIKTDKVWSRKKYWKIGIATPDLKRADGEDMSWKTEYSVFIQRGKTVYFHSKPIAGIMKIGLDYGFLDLTYSKLKFDESDYDNYEETMRADNYMNGYEYDGNYDYSDDYSDMMDRDLGMHKLDYAFHIGPSITINPVDHLMVQAYFHASPMVSGILENDKFSYGFGVATAAGLSVSYKAISIGAECNWSKIKYTQASFDDDEEDLEDSDNIFTTKKFKLKNTMPRFYISFRF